MSSERLRIGLSAALLIAGIAVVVAPSVKARLKHVKTDKPTVSIAVKDGYRYIVSNGIPNHPTGKFPNRWCPNTIEAQAHSYRAPVTPKESAGGRRYRGFIFGVADNGIPLDPGTAEIWNNNFEWHYEAMGGYLLSHESGLGVDKSSAHVQPDGTYHYHGIPVELLKKRDYKNRMAFVGYAADGYPIYGPYGYSDAQNPNSAMKEFRSSYRLKEGQRPSGPTGVYDGSFAQDYEYVKGAGDLDEFNGRSGVTPEYPNGTYYYVLTTQFPYVPRNFKGIPDESFHKMVGPPPGGRR